MGTCDRVSRRSKKNMKTVISFATVPVLTVQRRVLDVDPSGDYCEQFRETATLYAPVVRAIACARNHFNGNNVFSQLSIATETYSRHNMRSFSDNIYLYDIRLLFLYISNCITTANTPGERIVRWGRLIFFVVHKAVFAFYGVFFPTVFVECFRFRLVSPLKKSSRYEFGTGSATCAEQRLTS